VPLSKARNLEPDKASIREALGRALFYARRYERAAAEFQAVASRTPTTTMRSSASGVRCSCSDVTARRASLWHSPPRCAPSGPTTGSIATGRAAMPSSAERATPELPDAMLE